LFCSACRRGQFEPAPDDSLPTDWTLYDQNWIAEQSARAYVMSCPRRTQESLAPRTRQTRQSIVEHAICFRGYVVTLTCWLPVTAVGDADDPVSVW
jgi:hypothetical protein